MSEDDGTWNKILRTIMGQFRLSFPPLVAKRLMLLALVLIKKNKEMTKLNCIYTQLRH